MNCLLTDFWSGNSNDAIAPDVFLYVVRESIYSSGRLKQLNVETVRRRYMSDLDSFPVTYDSLHTVRLSLKADSI